MDLFFFAIESPLFPGALLALFFALAARVMTLDHEVAVDTPHILRPAPHRAVAPEVAEPLPPKTIFDFDRIAQSVPESVESEEPAPCYDYHDAPTDPDMPIRWI